MVLGAAAAAAQGGIHFPAKMFMPKFSRLNPVPGIKRAFGAHSAWEAIKVVVKSAVLGAVLYFAIKDLVPAIIGRRDAAAGAAERGRRHRRRPDALRRGGGSGDGRGRLRRGAAAHPASQTYMTKDEVKQEHKNTEGDPHLKGAIRTRQIAMSRNRMMADLPKADVVMVNPRTSRWRWRYDPALGAPRVIAKGAGAIATKIREKATEHRSRWSGHRAGPDAVQGRGDRPGDPAGAVRGGGARARVRHVPKVKGAAAGLHRQRRLVSAILDGSGAGAGSRQGGGARPRRVSRRPAIAPRTSRPQIGRRGPDPPRHRGRGQGAQVGAFVRLRQRQHLPQPASRRPGRPRVGRHR